ncbi:FAD:protein FMN transferase [Thalassotalea fusca]
MKVNKYITIAVMAVATVFLAGCFPNNESNPYEKFKLQGRTMGTTYNITIVTEKGSLDTTALQAEIDQLLVDVNQSMSTYIDDSELSRFNQYRGQDPVQVSPELALVVTEAIRLGKLSQGKLDVTAGKLINLWGFGPDKRPDVVPSEEDIALARSQSGIDKLEINGEKLTKLVPELYVDLSTIAKGYGVDVVADLIEKKGINNYIVEIGGEMRLKGKKETGELWHVAVEKPVSNERAIYQFIVPLDNAVATSGDYRNYFEDNGKRYSHIIDPHTAQPIDHKLVSVTVIHPSSMTADGLSTAMMVMGEKKALAFAEENDIAALLIYKSENGFIEQSTVKFMQYMK